MPPPPSWDRKWLSRLLRAAALPRHGLRLADTVEAHRRVIAEVFVAAGTPAEQRPALLRAALDEADRRFTTDHEAAHRALEDARLELGKWRIVREIAEQMLRSEGGPG